MISRIVVKNLPLKISEEEIRSKFSIPGTITDLKMIYKDNKFRRVCFIGYRNTEEAIEAIKYWNNAYIMNHKIKVDQCKVKVFKEEELDNETERRIVYNKTIFIRNMISVFDDIGDEIAKTMKIDINDFDLQVNDLGVIVKFKESDDALKFYKNVKVLCGKRIKLAVYEDKHNEIDQGVLNPLYFNFDSILKGTLNHKKIEKEDIIDIKDCNLGSKISLLETTLIENTIKFFESHGIDYKVRKDKKNLNLDKTTLILRSNDLFDVLDKMNGNCDVYISPSKCLALLRFKNEKDSIKIKRKFNLSKHDNEIIYCEFASKLNNNHVQKVSKTFLDSKNTKFIDKTDAKSLFRNFAIDEKKEISKFIVKNLPF
ncbi:RBM19 [Hepatospora eriocheir]|uniref:RBM19 n=1 Tax=Hepatospora eriocheir TaxID=1081669 RepID=A0A1X0QFV8_9MICR|nr:RBM19 [Hepatospora eriocheir]